MRILIATPLYGGSEHGRVSFAFMNAMLDLCRDASLSILGGVHHDTDIVRARSRAVREALAVPDMTHVLFWDEDVIAPTPRLVACLRGMLAADRPFVAAPYPRKRYHWDLASQAALAGRDAEGAAVDFPHAFAGDQFGDGWRASDVVKDCIEIAHAPLGFALCKRSMLEQMCAYYREFLGFSDVYQGKRVPTVALFQLLMQPPDGVLLSEDYSFCERWRRIGGQVWLYIGDGAPLDHVGSNVFKGKREGLIRAT